MSTILKPSSSPAALWQRIETSSTGQVAAFLVVLATICYTLLKANSGPNLKRPPGPKGLPLIGHTHLMMGVKFPWLKFTEWSQQLEAPVLFLRLGTSNVVVLNTAKAIGDLMERKGGIYGDRPRLIVANELISDNRRMVLTGYSDRWRKMRRALHAMLNDKACNVFEPVQERETKVLALNLLENPDGFADHYQLYSSNIILETVYDRRAKDAQDECIQGVLKDMEMWTPSALPGAHIVEDFPILHNLPDWLAPWKKFGRDIHEFELQLYTKLAQGVRKKMARGVHPDAIMCYLYQHQKEWGLDDTDILYLAGTLFEAGSDTTTSTLIALTLACATHPNLSAEIQAEVDKGTKPDRLPTFTDLVDMPILDAVAKEIGRWRPPVPQGVPHALTEDDEYMGYHLPKGSTVIGNTWAVGRDPELFPDGETVRPTRYFGEEGRKIEAALPKGNTTFGFGRRTCPGLHVAERNLRITIATLFWGFDVLPKPGHEIADPLACTEGFVCRPRAFDALIRPRSEEKARVIRAEGTQALADFADMMHD